MELKKKVLGGIAAGAVGATGLLAAGVALLWVAGSLGISTAAASQIVDAIMAGGLALSIVMAIFGGGIISAIIATVRWYVTRRGKAIAVA